MQSEQAFEAKSTAAIGLTIHNGNTDHLAERWMPTINPPD